MAMSKESRREVGKSRELLWHFLEGEKCFFCKKPFLENGVPRYVKFGNASANPMDLDCTIHHKDGDHENNKQSNRALAHQSCHRSFHAKQVFGAWRKAVAA